MCAKQVDIGKGAAMRVLPIALACYGQPEKTTIFANNPQAHVTHHNALSDAACETLVFMGWLKAIDETISAQCSAQAKALLSLGIEASLAQEID